MIKIILIIIIIIVLLVDLYFTKDKRFKKENTTETFLIDNKQKTLIKNNDKSEKTDNLDDNNYKSSLNIIEQLNPDPWVKIEELEHINKYYIYIKKINKHLDKILIWKQLPSIRNDLIDVDLNNNYLILKTQNEEEALVICNLILSYINNDISINDVLSRNLINSSITKAKKYNLVNSKLTELINNLISIINSEDDQIDDSDEMTDHDIEEIRKEILKEPTANKTTTVKIEKITNTIDENINHHQMPNNNNSQNNNNFQNNSQNNSIQDNNEDKYINKNDADMAKSAPPFDRFMKPSKVMPYEGTEYATINFG
jgi:hypothetical protein